MNVKWKLAALLAGTAVIGCKVLESGPVVATIVGIDIAPARLTLMPFQSAELTIDPITSRPDSSIWALLQWSTTGGIITNNFLAGGVRHVTYQSPAQTGDYLFIVTTAHGWPADTARITVTSTAVPVHTVTVTPGTVNLVAGDTTTLRATLADSSGSVLVGRAIEWSSSDGLVAIVLATGAVRAMTAGTATITATSEGHSGTAVVTVTAAPAP